MSLTVRTFPKCRPEVNTKLHPAGGGCFPASPCVLATFTSSGRALFNMPSGIQTQDREESVRASSLMLITCVCERGREHLCIYMFLVDLCGAQEETTFFTPVYFSIFDSCHPHCVVLHLLMFLLFFYIKKIFMKCLNEIFSSFIEIYSICES